MKTVAAVAASTFGAAGNRTEDTLRILEQMPADVCLLPGGWFSAGEATANRLIARLEKRLADAAGERLICLGVDGRDAVPWARDQLGVAITKDGIVGKARKFHTAPGERGVLAAAQDYRAPEDGLSRIVKYDGFSFYLAICYDCFGIRQQNVPNPEVDAVLTSIHGFYPAGQRDSGAAYFARHGVAGASKAWGVPAFASAGFYDRPVPERWPTGVLWTSGERSTTAWTYGENGIQPQSSRTLQLRCGPCRIDRYRIRKAVK